jgi:CRP-like cAMP-binding protein
MTVHVPGMLTRTHKKSSALYLQGETCEGIFIVLHGVVALSTGIDLNRQVRVVRCRKGSVLGLAETIGRGRYQTTATAITDVTTQFVPKTDILGAIGDEPTTGLQLLQVLCADLSELYRRIKEIGAARVSGSIVRTSNIATQGP